MSWSIDYSSEAKQDLRNIFEYIANNLLEPETALKQIQRIMKKIRSLNEMPLRYRLYSEEPWQSLGLRLFPVNNYLVFYLPNEKKRSVSIVRIMYGGRDISEQLSESM